MILPASASPSVKFFVVKIFLALALRISFLSFYAWKYALKSSVAPVYSASGMVKLAARDSIASTKSKE